MSIKSSILLPVLAVLVAGIILLVGVVGSIASETANDLTSRLVEARVNQYGQVFASICMDTYGAIEAITPIIADTPERSDNAREEAVGTLCSVLDANSSIIGAWTCWEPNAFDGKDSIYVNAEYHDSSGRFVPYVIRDGSGYSVTPLDDYDTSEFYTGARNSAKPYITDPYYYNVNGKSTLIYSIAIPVIQNGAVMGVVGMDILPQDAIDAMNKGTILDVGYLYTLSPTGLIFTHQNADLLLTHYDKTWMSAYQREVDNIAKNGGEFTVTTYSDQLKEDIVFLASGVQIGKTERYWVICGVVPLSKVNASATMLLFTVIGIGLALILFIGGTMLFIVRRSLKKLPSLTSTAEAIAIGDIHNAHLSNDSSPTKNEIELLDRAFSRMTAAIRDQSDLLSRIAAGDYSLSIPVRSENDSMNIAINELLDQTNAAMMELAEASGQVSSGATQIANGAQSLAMGATEQAASIEELSSTLGEISAQSEANTRLAMETLEDTEKAGSLMGGSIQRMDELVKAMATINDKSRNIENVIKVIDEIAFQTNILALNASVEAAHAGAQGAGFAVVADEVRTLAQKSADAARESADLIQDSVASVKEGTMLASQTSDSLEEVGEIAGKNAQAMRRISEASQRQSVSISQVNEGVEQISSVVQANSASAQESAASSQEMSAQSAVLNRIITRFKLRDENKRLAPPARQHINPPAE